MTEQALDTGNLPRELGVHGGRTAGPLVICIGGMHGNEPAGVFAARRVLEELRSVDPPFKGTLVALTGNRGALARRCRYLDEDFNRMWLPQRIAELCSASLARPLNREECECRELFAAIQAAFEAFRGPVVFVDLHTTSASGIPFAIVADTLVNRRLVLDMPAPVVLGLEEHLEGTTLNYMNDKGYAAVGFEGGQNEAVSSIEHNEAALWTILAAAGCIREQDVERARLVRQRLAECTAGVPAVLEVRYRHAVDPAHGFVMEPGYVNFQPVRRGEALARDDRGAIRARERGRILLPLYQSQGSDGFFIVRRVRPVWLRLSALMRRAGVQRVMPMLPGIRRHPLDPDSLIVDPRVARWLVTEVFHLLGFRRAHSDDGRIVMSRRAGDEASLSRR